MEAAAEEEIMEIYDCDCASDEYCSECGDSDTDLDDYTDDDCLDEEENQLDEEANELDEEANEL